MLTFYRIHPADEPAETVLIPTRPDGWTVEDEDDGTVAQPYGVACCESLQALARYVRQYSMAPQLGDRVLEVLGYPSHEGDRDPGACRVIITEVVRELPLSAIEEAS